MKLSVAAFALSLSVPAFSHPVIGILDGETLTLQINQKPVRIRLANIDAPERAQAFGRQSRQSLTELCMGKEAEYKEQDPARHAEIMALVTCNGVEVNRVQIERGMAWVHDRHNNDFTLPALQLMARRDRKGLWADANPVPPWEFRRPQIKRASSPPPASSTDPAICFVDRRGEYRIIDGVRRYGC